MEEEEQEQWDEHLVYNNRLLFEANVKYHFVREAAQKRGLTLKLSQRGGGGQGPIQIKMTTFCHRQVPTKISFILPHIHGGASLSNLINSTLE